MQISYYRFYGRLHCSASIVDIRTMAANITTHEWDPNTSDPSSLVPFRANDVNSGAYLFEKEDLKRIGIGYPHMSFESYQSYQEKTQKDPSNADVRKFITKEDRRRNKGKNLLHAPRYTCDVEGDWKGFKTTLTVPPVMDCDGRYITGCAEYNAVARIESSLDDLTRARVPVSKFFLLGMGSVHDRDQGKTAVYQYLLARLVITNYFNKLFGNQGHAAEVLKPEIVFDATFFNKSDVDFLGKKFGHFP